MLRLDNRKIKYVVFNITNIAGGETVAWEVSHPFVTSSKDMADDESIYIIWELLTQYLFSA